MASQEMDLAIARLVTSLMKMELAGFSEAIEDQNVPAEKTSLDGLFLVLEHRQKYVIQRQRKSLQMEYKRAQGYASIHTFRQGEVIASISGIESLMPSKPI